MVIERSDEVKPEPETPSPVAIRLFENAKDFELTNDVESYPLKQGSRSFDLRQTGLDERCSAKMRS